MAINKFFIIIFCFTLVIVDAQKNIDQVLRKYKNDEGVINMNFTGEILKMINSTEKKLKSQVEIVDVLVFQKSKDIDSQDKNDIQKVLTRDKFDLLVDVKIKTQKVKLYALDAGEYLNKVYAQVNTEDMNAYFILSGRIVFEELAKLGMDFQSGDALKILDSAKKK